MADLSQAEQILFSTFWGKDNLIDDEEFWLQVMMLLMPEDKMIALPLHFNLLTVRRVLDMLQCPVGKCGLCCHYPRVTMSDTDIDKILKNTDYTEDDLAKVIQQDERGKFMNCSGEGGCFFLKDNSCTIYKYRPDVCYLFPIQGGVDAMIEGQAVQIMRIKLKCLAAIEVTRAILRESLAAGNLRLLPDLSLVPLISPEITEGGNKDG